MLNHIRSAIEDLHSAFRKHHVWIALANEDIGDQHRRTTLGPAWLLFNYLAFACTFIFVFKRGSGAANYETYVATGLLVWFYIMETINGSVSLFVREEGFIKGTTLPLSTYVMRMAMQAIIRSAYALVGCAIILAATGEAVTLAWIWSALAAILIILITPAAIIPFAFLGAYFPDSQFIISNLMRLGMFLTPVFWAPGNQGGIREFLYVWNPFTYFLEIVRLPILTGQVPIGSFAFCFVIGIVLWVLSLLLLGGLRKQVVFVL